MDLLLAIQLFVTPPSAAPTPGPKRSVALASGIRLSYVEAGPENAPPLILLHGLGDTSRSWSLMLPALARTHRVYALDQRGHGDTESPACCYALADLAHDVAAFMDHKRIGHAAVVGHSLGSFVTQYLAATRPERVERLALVASSDTTVGTDVIEWLWSQTIAFEAAPPPAFVEEWQANPTPVDAAFLAKVKAETFAVRPHVWRGVAQSLRIEDLRRLHADIRMPALIVSGEKDPAFPPAHQERLRRALPGARFKSYPRVGHNLHWEIPQAVAADLAAFLSETAVATRP